MARLALGNHAKLSWLLLRGGLRQFAGRINGHPLWRWPLLPFRADRLLIAPPDLRTADATRASEIYSGRFAFSGKVVICDGRSIFDMDPPSEEWAAELLGFALAAPSACRRIRRSPAPTAARWSTSGSRCKAPGTSSAGGRTCCRGASSPGSARRRWCCRTPTCAFYRRFLRSLVRQVRYLRHTAGDARRGVAHLQAMHCARQRGAVHRRAVAPHQRATERLRQELQKQILPDGGHVGRDPGAIIEILLELLPLRQVYASRNIAPPPALLNAIDRMMPMLRFFRHSDGTLRALQRHGRDAGRSAADAARLR